MQKLKVELKKGEDSIALRRNKGEKHYVTASLQEMPFYIRSGHTRGRQRDKCKDFG